MDHLLGYGWTFQGELLLASIVTTRFGDENLRAKFLPKPAPLV
jgi:hypothetical protein